MHTRCFSSAGCKSSSQVCPSLLILSSTTYVSYTIIFILLLTKLGCTFSYWFVFFQPQWLPAVRGNKRYLVSCKTRTSSVSTFLLSASAFISSPTLCPFYPPLTVAWKIHMKKKWLDLFRLNASGARQQIIWWHIWRSIWKEILTEKMCIAQSVVMEVSPLLLSYGMLIMQIHSRNIYLSFLCCSLHYFSCNLNRNTRLLWFLGTR